MVSHQKRDGNDLYGMPILGFLFKNAQFLIILKILVVGIFFYAIYLGILEPDKEKNTFTTAVFWHLFWPLFVVVTLSTFGRLFCGVCPHGFLGKYITKIGLKQKMPKTLSNPMIGVMLLIVGFWVVYYIYPQAYKTPLAAAILFLFMTIVAFAFFYIYKDMAYCKSICPVGTLMRVFSKVSFTWLSTYKESCQSCRTFECASACPYALKPFAFDTKNSMSDCTLCMDCASACEAVSFKVVKPSKSLLSKFQISKAEIWAVLLITAAITITMSFHHALSRVAISDEYIWSKMGVYLQGVIGIEGLDYIGMSALFCAMVSTIFLAGLGNFIASRLLKVDFSKAFYTLSYAYIPIFIIGGLSHTYEFFFVHHYSDIVNGFINGFGLDIENVKPLATRKDSWIHIFGIMNYIAIIWALVILAKRVNLFDAKKSAKAFAFFASSLLILFYLGLNIYKGYAFSTYGVKKSGHSHGVSSTMFQSVPFPQATLLQSGELKNSGIVCGMKLNQFYKTNHSAVLDGEIRQYCSIHCLAEDIFVKRLDLKNIQVVDVASLNFIDAKSAFYVVGSKIKGTMSEVSKYAFQSEIDAKEFAAQNGGKIASFDEALQIALKDFK